MLRPILFWIDKFSKRVINFLEKIGCSSKLRLKREEDDFIITNFMTRQGQSFRQIGLYLPRPVFIHGQLYVAFSRVRSKKGLKMIIHDEDGNMSNTTTKVVYKEVLHNL